MWRHETPRAILSFYGWRATSAERRRPPRGPAECPINDRTLLVIEDARDQALLIRVAARRAAPGLDVRVAGDGREGIAYLAGTPPFQDRRSHPIPDLIVLDLLMPEVDGFAVLEWMRSQSPPVTVPVVVLTSSEGSDHEARSLQLGAKTFRRKPDDFAALASVVRSIVDQWVGSPLNPAEPPAG